MKKVVIKALILLLSGGMVNSSYAWNPPANQGGGVAGGTGSGGGQNVMSTKASNCTPTTERLFMDYNDLRVLIETGGIMWQDRQNNRGSYFAPKPPAGVANAPSVIYAGALWMGGTDVNGQLKLAGMLFATRGRDYWTGPLGQANNFGNFNHLPGSFNPTLPVPGDVDVRRPHGAATITATRCIEFDRFFSVSKAMVREYITWWECSQDPSLAGCTADNSINPQTYDFIVNVWPAHGNIAAGEDFYLAPYFDRDQSGDYNPIEGGDYPWYDFDDEVDCLNDRRVTLFGDDTHWWVFNDKGNIHGESGGDPIGMEVRAQAFTFATNDQVNQMTFYNYEMINRSTQTLFNTYFCQYADADIGGSEDDYAGCDVSRGLGYAMNGDAFDDDLGGARGYGDRPPAVGIDFFEGPYQDNDQKDNLGPVRNELGELVVPSVAAARADGGIVYSGLGIGYGDGVVDNERFGMKRYITYGRAGTGGTVAGINDDPNSAVDFYRFMTGFFKNNERMSYGGNGFEATGSNPTVIADYMFPGASDPLGWGTPNSVPQSPWDEFTDNNPAGDRRFLQAAGPFTLRPGAVNNLTVGVVFARGKDYLDSREQMIRADTKAQALFDNCFQILEPPMAPRLRITKLENQLILMLDNPAGSNNQNEDYEIEDRVNIVDPVGAPAYDKFYRFEGYQIFQLIDDTYGIQDIGNTDFARLVAQCDKVNNIGRLINYEFDEELNVVIPRLMVDGENKGLRHTFSVTEDLFASGSDKRLVNHKTYHYIAIAYAQNNFKTYSPNPDGYDGQQTPYIASRLSATGQSVSSVPGVPSNPMPSNFGAYVTAQYGTRPEITRLDGRGNMGLNTDLHAETIKAILNNAPVQTPKYALNRGPIDVKVVDPINVQPGHYELKFVDVPTNTAIDTAKWIVTRYTSKGGDAIGDPISSERSIAVGNEQLILEWGVSINIEQYLYKPAPGIVSPTPNNFVTEPIEATISFADSSQVWLAGVRDQEGESPFNWILSGSAFTEDNPCFSDEASESSSVNRDKNQVFENLLGGVIAPFGLIRTCGPGAPIAEFTGAGATPYLSSAQNNARIASANGIDLVFTSNKSLWTRSVVVELCPDPNIAQGGGRASKPRARASVDKNGLSAGQAGYNVAEGDLVSATGMGWFPGYAIDVETGRRLNIAFGENSFLAGENGSDMKWNPTSRFFDNVFNPLFGGQHVIYVIGEDVNGSGMPNYDNGEVFYSRTSGNVFNDNRSAWQSVMWVAYPMLVENRNLLATDVTVRVRVAKRFENLVLSGVNNGRPAFEWNMDAIATEVSSDKALSEALEMINVVPNPYYAYSQYERDRIDNRVKIVNLPDRCQINIYNLSGKLIRGFDKASPVTSLDWDLKNHKGIPIAGGVYLIHVRVINEQDGEIGERVIKWFGGMRQPDFQNL